MYRLIIIIVLFQNIKVAAQSATFFKFITSDENSDESYSDFKIDSDDNYFFNFKSICIGKPCLSLIKTENTGDYVWLKNYKWADAGNKNTTVIYGDTLYVGIENNKPYDAKVGLLLVDKNTGDSITYLEASIPNWELAIIDGVEYLNNKIFVYGWGRIVEDTSLAFIQTFNIDRTLGKFQKIKLPFNYFNPIHELQKDSNQNLVSSFFFPFYNLTTKNFDSKVILTMNDELELLDREDYWKEEVSGTNQYLPMSLTIGKNNERIFNYWQEDEEVYLKDNVRIQCTDDKGKKLWKYDVPDKPFSQTYKLTDLSTAKNGDVLAVGFILTTDSLQSRRVIFTYRINGKTGELIWERRINFKNIAHEFEDHTFPNKIYEDVEGNIVIVANHLYKFNAKHDDIALLKLDSNGCINGYVCDEKLLILEYDLLNKIEDVNYFSEIFPNPSVDKITIHSNKKINRVIVLNSLGQIDSEIKEFENEIDVSSLSTGVKIAIITFADGSKGVSRFIKI